MTEKNVIVPVYFDGLSAAEMLNDLICVCTGKNLCKTHCTCRLQNLACTEICKCSDSHICWNNGNTDSPDDGADLDENQNEEESDDE